MSDSENFEIKSQHFHLLTCLCFIFLFAVFAVIIIVRLAADATTRPVEWCILSVAVIPILLLVVMILYYSKIRFIYKDGVFMYKVPFAKVKSVKAEGVSCVKIRKAPNDFNSVSFIGKDGKVALTFNDDGTVIICKMFTDLLERLAIPINYS